MAYSAKLHSIIESWQCYGVGGDYNGVILKVLGDKWINPQILSIQSLEAHHRSEMKFHVKGFSKGACELGDKFRAAVRGDVVRDIMLGENMNGK